MYIFMLSINLVSLTPAIACIIKLNLDWYKKNCLMRAYNFEI